jgi:hypothetical protein
MWHPSFPQQPLVATPHTISAPMAGLIAHAASYSALNPPEAARENLIPTTADSKFNLPQMLHNKINQHYYFKQLLTDYPTFDDILGVISEVSLLFVLLQQIVYLSTEYFPKNVFPCDVSPCNY